MDTKLKKSHKLATIIITLCILMPAFLLTALYPRMSNIMQKEAARYDKLNKELEEERQNSDDEEVIREWTFKNQYVNYAMEASYYLYGQCLEEASNIKVDYNVLERYGWNSDFERVSKNSRYLAKYNVGNQVFECKNADVLEEEDTLGYLTLAFDSYGYLADASLDGELQAFFDNDGDSLQAKAKKSMEQYKNNVKSYENSNDIEFDENQLVPKNFVVTFALDEDSEFVYVSTEDWYDHYYYYSPEGLARQIGVEWIVAALLAFVAVMALVLPFFKKLNTGFEKIFSIPLEFVAGIAFLVVAGVFVMFSFLSWTCAYKHDFDIAVLGYEISQKNQFIALLILNFLGWALLFFLAYVVVAAFRQFLCRPKYYLQNRILCINILKWLGKKASAFGQWVLKMDLSKKMRMTVFKIVLINYCVLAIAFSIAMATVYYLDDNIWPLGLFILFLYSFALFFVLCKVGSKLQRQYNNILQATNSMAEGNLKISLDEKLGIFEPIATSLKQVQQGFQKSVLEEAKSQSMKTELITNVSHDLKTPLTAIITYVDLLKKENATEEERKSYIETLDRKSQRLKVLIEDLFEVSKAQSGNVTVNFMDVDIVSLFKQVRSEMIDRIEESNLIFRFNLPDEKIMLSLDGQRTYRIFENLLQNTLKYAMPHSRVYVDMIAEGQEVKVIFRNTSAQELFFEPERLTERFVRGDASRNSEGSGLGLAIAKSFMELQNGKLNIDIDGDLFKVSLTFKR